MKAMAYWLLKTEPDEYSWNDQLKRGAKGEAWTGVRNFTARRYLKEMKKGDKFFFYHTGDEKQVVGIGEVTREAFADPSAGKGEPCRGSPVTCVAMCAASSKSCASRSCPTAGT